MPTHDTALFKQDFLRETIWLIETAEDQSSRLIALEEFKNVDESTRSPKGLPTRGLRRCSRHPRFLVAEGFGLVACGAILSVEAAPGSHSKCAVQDDKRRNQVLDNKKAFLKRELSQRFCLETACIDQLIPYTDRAIARARALDSKPGERWSPGLGTRVYRLVEQLQPKSG